MAGTRTESLPLLPLNTGVVLPQMVVTIALETDEARRAGRAAAGAGDRLLLVPRVDGRYAAVGTVAAVESSGDLPGGAPALVVRGLHRARISGAAIPDAQGALTVVVESIVDSTTTARATELAREYRALVETILERRGARRLAGLLQGADDPGALADTAGYWPELTTEQRVELLETVDVEARLELVVGWAREWLADLELQERIRHEVTDGLEDQQREMLLRRQMDAIRKELGETDDDVSQYRDKLATVDLPEAVHAQVTREIDRLERMGAQNPEQQWIRTWLDTVFDVPWGKQADEHSDLAVARAVLDADHEGLERVKERIVEFLAVRTLRRERDFGALDGRGSGAILALVGPPGVGKTSLGESVARALGRPFVRVAVGGVRDEAEIRGHRRTYVGARPGRIVRALTEAGAMNPVVLIDELDKVSPGAWSGDPSSALLEVLDPAQNHTFRDHYLEVDLDLSEVIFLATANVLDTIPAPLLDRLEIVTLDGYTEDEKVSIARHHLLARQRARAGLHDDELSVTDAALHAIVSGYTREAGVRELERRLGTLARKAARTIAERTAREDRDAESTDAAASGSVTVDVDDLRELLGRPRFRPEDATRAPLPGLATGLAVTGTGGDVLTIEATVMDGEAGLLVTGQLGAVMSESAQLALSFVRANAEELGVPAGAFDQRRFHLHVPAGAVPKDGPSAGITMTTALASLLTGRPVKPNVGMTGEVTLQGRVLPIGGVKQKVLAAHRAGLTEVILPIDNEGDLDDVPEAVREEMTFHLARDVREVLPLALT
ncbi:MAG TPA: endopeptidase La [Acidimicrobiia bacterium]|nr:endopeptidase La [Acidimicrobiia bacterium]